MKQFLIAGLLFANSVCAEQCVIQERTVSQGSVVIQERSGVRQEVVPLPNGLRRCQVSFRARIGADWHTAFGEHDWRGDLPREQACGVAVKHAEDAVRASIFCAKTQTRELFNIGNDREITIRDAVKVIAEELGHSDPEWTTSPGKAGSTATRRPNIDKLRSVMSDYKPMSFEQGVKRIIKNLVDKS